MAEALGHKFGNQMGAFFESAFYPLVQEFAAKHDLYLDRKGSRPVRKKAKKVKWIDTYGVSHDLDFVLERGGTAQSIGEPVAFIETAWRRYVKHSRNKVQEIQGALLPIKQRHRYSAPFLGAFLAGDYTDGALDALRRCGFQIVFFPYANVVRAFATVKVDVSSEEDTPDVEFKAKIEQLQSLSNSQRQKVWKKLASAHAREIVTFMEALERAVTRRITVVTIIPLHGKAVECPSIDDAITFIQGYVEHQSGGPLVRYEVRIRYTNGDNIDGQFRSKLDAIDFLRVYLPGEWRMITDDVVPTEELVEEENGDGVAE